MSIYTKILSTLGVASIVIAGSVIGSAQTTGTLTAPLSNSSFTYCNWTNMMATSDVEAARVIGVAGLPANTAAFYVTENTSLNVVNGKCVANMVANFVPYITGHQTSFDITSGGAVTNVKVMNANPEIMSVTCDGNDTVIKFKDANQDVLTYQPIIGANDFDAPSTSNESNNVLKVTLKRKDSAFTGTNNATIYINETAPVITGTAGFKPANTATTGVAYTDVAVTMDKAPTTSKLSLTLKGVCDASLYTTSSMVSSSSMMSSMNSSMAMSSSSMMMSSNGMTTVVSSGKGVLTRTGGSN